MQHLDCTCNLKTDSFILIKSKDWYGLCINIRLMIKKMISTFAYKDKLELGGSVYIFIYKNVRENYPVHTLSIIALICEKFIIIFILQ